ncbi:MAG: lipopolysaccharide heptosyltransferase I [Pseudomonadota bacterium]
MAEHNGGLRLLIVRMSSLGDVVHALPAITDAAQAHPLLRVDWLVEESFAEIPRWHHAVDRVIPVKLRHWRKHPIEALTSSIRKAAWHILKTTRYDAIVDVQGLLKSAWLTSKAQGPKHGYDWSSAREPLASMFYNQRHTVAKGSHAITRVRELLSKALQYPVPAGPLNFGLTVPTPTHNPVAPISDAPYLIFFHGTTWVTKEWPVDFWRQLIAIAGQAGRVVYLPWGNPREQARAHALAHGFSHAVVLPALKLSALAYLIQQGQGVVTVDTGLGHIAGALNVPVVSLYGATDPQLTGIQGRYQHTLASNFSCAPCKKKQCHWNQAVPPCYEVLTPKRVWAQLERLWITQAQEAHV